MDKKREKLMKKIQPKKGLIKGGILGYLVGVQIFGSIGAKIFGPICAKIFGSINLSIIAIITGLICGVITAKFWEKRNATKREYFSLIDNHRVLSLDEIALSMSVSYEQAKKDISNMIEKGFFGNAHIDSTTRSVVLPITGVDMNTKVTESTKICPSCGATTKVSSIGESKCEYCGTILK